VGDKGVLVSANETIQIIDTKKENNLIYTKKLPENVNGILAKVDSKPRSDTTKKSLDALDASGIEKHREHVGTKGSLVSPNHLRFDFPHFAKVTDEELHQVEDFVNARIHNCH
jgi:alanyl-tRNA synthetase